MIREIILGVVAVFCVACVSLFFGLFVMLEFRVMGESLAKEKTDEAPEDPVEKPKYWYVYAENSEDIYGIPKGRDVKIGAYKTKEEAERLMEALAKEGKWKNTFVFPDDCVLCSDTVRIEVGELEESPRSEYISPVVEVKDEPSPESEVEQ